MADVQAGSGHAGGCTQAGDDGDLERGGVRGSLRGLRGREASKACEVESLGYVMAPESSRADEF
jgi:hypothetical protein